jgi:serine/threonine protein kinase
MDTSSFENETNNPFVFSDMVPVRSNGATSDTYKVLIYGKWHFLKRPKKIYLNNPLYISAFHKEFEIGYTLDHPNVVRYIIKGEDKDGVYILIDYVDGFTLTDFIKINPDYFNDINHLDKFATQLLSALKYIHERQILHLDLKPDNILITRVNSDVKLIDFGFSYTDCFSSLAIGKTDLYAAPEQLNNGEIDQRTDIYGFGKILEYIFAEFGSHTSKVYRKLIVQCQYDSKESRFNNVSEILSYLLDRSKFKKKIRYSILALFILGIGVFFYQYSIQHYPGVDESIVNETVIHKIDTVYIIDTLKQKTNEANAIDKYAALEKDIKQQMANNFKNVYKHDSLTDENYSSVLSEYQMACNKSLMLTETLSSKYKKIPYDDIAWLVLKEIEKKTALLQSQTAKYDERNREKMITKE